MQVAFIVKTPPSLCFLVTRGTDSAHRFPNSQMEGVCISDSKRGEHPIRINLLPVGLAWMILTVGHRSSQNGKKGPTKTRAKESGIEVGGVRLINLMGAAYSGISSSGSCNQELNGQDLEASHPVKAPPAKRGTSTNYVRHVWAVDDIGGAAPAFSMRLD